MIKGVIFDFNRTLYDPDAGRLNEGALDLLKSVYVAGFKLGLLTKKSGGRRSAKISELGLERYFSYSRMVDEVKKVSDFRSIIDAMGITPEETAVIGDRVRSEISIGNELGMMTIWYKSGKFADELPINQMETPTYTVTRLEDVLLYLM